MCGKRGICLMMACLLTAVGGGISMAETGTAAAKRTTVSVDFSMREGVPLLKKFGAFNSGIVDLPQYERDAERLDPLRLDSLRIDLFMGEDGRPFARVVDGTEDAMTYDFSKLDALVQLLDAHNVRPYWAWCYIPVPLQIDGNWRKGPNSLEQWQEMFRVFAEHYRESGLRIAYHEIYNEPDCGDVFFLGSMVDYTQMYISAARGLKAGDPDAVIGGPSTAFIDVTGDLQMRSFLNAVRDEEVPLDFFTYHSYGCEKKQYLSRTKQARAILSQYVDFDTTELHLNEYNSEIQPFLPGGRAERSIGAATMLTSFEILLEETDVTLAHWAQLMDTGYEPLGAIDPSGRIKASYQAFWMYSQMPEERVSLTGPGRHIDEGLHGMASADADTACILLWNDSDRKDVPVSLSLAELPFKEGRLEIYEVNGDTDPYWNGIQAGEVTPASVLPIAEAAAAWETTLPSGGLIFYRFVREEPERAAPVPIGTMIRKRYYFPERGKTSYAFFDETNQTAYLGMNGEYSSRAIVATEWKDLPQMVILQCRHGGVYREIDLNTSFSVRVDYAVKGAYVRSVLFSFMPINQRRDSSVPWGTGKEPDEIILTQTLMTGKSLLTIGAHAPADWDGRAILTYDLHSTGPGTWVELTAEGI